MRRKNLARLLAISIPLICLALAPPARHAEGAEDTDPFSKIVQPFLTENCTVCHNDGMKSGGLNLEAYKTAASVTADRDSWEKVLRKLRTGEMPPKEMPRPDKADVDAVSRWIE